MVQSSATGPDHVSFFLCPYSEELDLDDVMDIELDFPTLSESQNVPASQTTHSLLLEVSLFCDVVLDVVDV